MEDCKCPCEESCKQICLRNHLGDDCMFNCGCLQDIDQTYFGILLFSEKQQQTIIGLILKYHENQSKANAAAINSFTEKTGAATFEQHHSPASPSLKLGVRIALFGIVIMLSVWAYSALKARRRRKVLKSRSRINTYDEQQNIHLLTNLDAY